MQSTPADKVAALSDTALTRRRLIKGSAVVLMQAAVAGTLHAFEASPVESSSGLQPYSSGVLPAGIRSRFVNNINGVRMHVLEAGFEDTNRPAIVLLHGFPELAYSWRKVMVPLAAAGFHVIAPDRRGYGRTDAFAVSYDDDLAPFAILSHARDVLALTFAFGYRSVAAIVGHDFGSPLAAWCSLVRPDVFRSVVMMSAPFAATPALPSNTADGVRTESATTDSIYDELAKLDPPRKHYQKYYATREANDNLWHAPQGLHSFLRAYYHVKSADWKENAPYPLAARIATEWAKLPRYYIMDLDKGMAETVASEMPSPTLMAACKWLTEDELRVYSAEYERTGFQGGLNEYRVRWVGKYTADLQLFSGRTIDVPSLFIAGKSDWGVYQNPGDFESSTACTHLVGAHLLNGAGHWVQQEKPTEVSELIVGFIREAHKSTRG